MAKTTKQLNTDRSSHDLASHRNMLTGLGGQLNSGEVSTGPSGRQFHSDRRGGVVAGCLGRLRIGDGHDPLPSSTWRIVIQAGGLAPYE